MIDVTRAWHAFSVCSIYYGGFVPVMPSVWLEEHGWFYVDTHNVWIPPNYVWDWNRNYSNAPDRTDFEIRRFNDNWASGQSTSKFLRHSRFAKVIKQE